MTFLEALRSGSQIRQRSWSAGLWLEWSWDSLRWRLRANTGEVFDVLDGKQGCLTPVTLLADDWEARP